MEEKNNVMPQVPETPVETPVSTPIVEEPKMDALKEVSPVKVSWKKPIIKILIVGAVAVAIFLLLGR